MAYSTPRHEEAKRLSKLALSSTFDGSNQGLLLPLTQLALRLNHQASKVPCHHHHTPGRLLKTPHHQKVNNASTTGPTLETWDLCQNRDRAREMLLSSLEYVPSRDEVDQCHPTVLYAYCSDGLFSRIQPS
ncbi:hypothetical protein ElyMa_005708500 [Elysia marginata]|uniref:Uncharacterized protein n=1 Tax=Elysia marginata TaxID=1093978 RepID=A0AAV4FGL4_9GAST|nr:hypothetical protein ElyMa_005708500 [Elysia marginata]